MKFAANQKLSYILDLHGLSKYYSLFSNQRIDYDTFLLLDQDTLCALNVPQDKIPIFLKIIEEENQKNRHKEGKLYKQN